MVSRALWKFKEENRTWCVLPSDNISSFNKEILIGAALIALVLKVSTWFFSYPSPEEKSKL